MDRSSDQQACGKFVLRATAESLNYVELGLKDKSAGRQWYKMCNRMLTDLNHRCTMRTAPEEFNLSANRQAHDPTVAEFARSYMTQTFPGRRFVQLLETHLSGDGRRSRRGILPVRTAPVDKETIRACHLEEVYFYRGPDERVHYLSPWEFVMFWELHRIPAPRKTADDGIALSRWTEVDIPPGSAAEPGLHYVVNDVALSEHSDYVVLPDTPTLRSRFRHEWILRRAFRPFVPQPDTTPMPDRASSAEDRAKLYCLYLRPWVLERQDADPAVPHITELNLVPPPSLDRKSVV